MEQKITPEAKTYPEKKRTIITKLFLNMLYISSCTFGGGFVIVTFMKRNFVDKLHWISEQQMLDFTALAQSSPGPIAVNAAILVGWNTAGFAGMLAAVCGTIIPPLVILSAISFCYSAFSSNVYVALMLKGMQAGVAAVILDVSFCLGGNVIKEKSIVHCAITMCAFTATFFWKINVIFIILAAAATGIISWLCSRKRQAVK